MVNFSNHTSASLRTSEHVDRDRLPNVSYNSSNNRARKNSEVYHSKFMIIADMLNEVDSVKKGDALPRDRVCYWSWNTGGQRQVCVEEKVVCNRFPLGYTSLPRPRPSW